MFPQWHISSHTSFFFSLLVIAALGVFYEYLRVFQVSLDRKIAISIASRTGQRSASSGGNSPEIAGEEVGLLGGRKKGYLLAILFR